MPTAIRLCNSLEDAGAIDWFEEPVPVESYHALSQVRDKVNVAISVGERLHTRWEFVPIFENKLAGQKLYRRDCREQDFDHSALLLPGWPNGVSCNSERTDSSVSRRQIG